MKIHEIESAQNRVYLELCDLLSSQGLTEQGRALIFGSKATGQILAQHFDRVIGAVIHKEMEASPVAKVHQLYKLSKGLFRTLDIFGTAQPILIVKVPPIPDTHEGLDLKGCSLVIPFQDPGNVGALLRTAAGFGVNQILLASGSAHPFHPKSTRAASGAVFAHRYFRLTHLSDIKLPCIALDAKGQALNQYVFPKDFVLVPGVEGTGLSEEVRRVVAAELAIPLHSSVESLNATIATSIALYSWRLQQG